MHFDFGIQDASARKRARLHKRTLFVRIQRWKVPKVKWDKIAHVQLYTNTKYVLSIVRTTGTYVRTYIHIYRTSATCGLVGYLFDGWMSSMHALGSEFRSWTIRLISAANCKIYLCIQMEKHLVSHSKLLYVFPYKEIVWYIFCPILTVLRTYTYAMG